MTDAKVDTPGKGQRDRSPSFPFISLETAIERLTDFEAHHKRASVTADRIGPAWGMKAGTSQAQQTIAALKAYGLLESQRGPNGSEVSVSEEGRTYLLARQDSIKRQVLERAAIKPKQIAIYWREWGADRPKDEVCLDALGFNGQFSKDGAEKFLKIYDATIAFAGLTDSDKIATDLRDEEFDGEAGEAAPPPPPPPPAQGKVRIMDGERVVFTEESNPQQYVKLVVSGDVDETLLDALQDYVKRQKKRLGIDPPKVTADNKEASN